MAAILLCTAAMLLAQSQDGSTPAPSTVRAKGYPRIHKDGRVTFRVKAPDAKKVAVAGRAADSGMNGNTPFEMTRLDDGTWEVTTPTPVRPGFQYYELIIDGHKMNDPSS
jgi:enterochelin esterase family protein